MSFYIGRFLDEVLMGDNTQVNLESVDFYVGIIDDRNGKCYLHLGE